MYIFEDHLSVRPSAVIIVNIMANKLDNNSKRSQFWNNLWAFPKWLWHVIKRTSKPLLVIKQQKGLFMLWFLFTIIAGLLGPIINIINNCWFGEKPMEYANAVLLESLSGTFYTFSVVLIASSLGTVLLKMFDLSNKFLKIKLYYIAICIFPMLIGAVCYSSHMRSQTVANQLSKSITAMTDTNVEVDIIQLIFFIIAVIIGIYAFCLQYMSLNPDKFPELQDDYVCEEENRIQDTTDLGSQTEYNGAQLNG